MVHMHNKFDYAIKKEPKNSFKIQIYYILLHFFENLLNKLSNIVQIITLNQASPILFFVRFRLSFAVTNMAAFPFFAVV